MKLANSIKATSESLKAADMDFYGRNKTHGTVRSVSRLTPWANDSKTTSFRPDTNGHRSRLVSGNLDNNPSGFSSSAVGLLCRDDGDRQTAVPMGAPSLHFN
ncbi:hypothetical protein J6590_012198 [Homalodisca vitripennis]|nr:hypothetical protein J6590_012198 [Homalodisca vitripennis]